MTNIVPSYLNHTPASEATLFEIKDTIPRILNAVGQNPALATIAQDSLFHSWSDISPSVFSGYCTDFTKVHSDLKNEYEKMKEAMTELNEIPDDVDQCRSQIKSLEKRLEQFDLSCGGLTQAQFDDDSYYQPKAAERQQLLNQIETLNKKLTRLNSFSGTAEKIESLQKTGMFLNQKSKSIVDDFMGILMGHRTTEAEALTVLQRIRSTADACCWFS